MQRDDGGNKHEVRPLSAVEMLANLVFVIPFPLIDTSISLLASSRPSGSDRLGCFQDTCGLSLAVESRR
jgi:hypothetical protein